MEKYNITIVMPDKKGIIAPELYGHFVEHIGGVVYDGLWVGKESEIPNVNGFREDIVEKLRAIQPAVIRWPGGCFAEVYNWRDGIGAKRPVRPSWWTGFDGKVEDNQVGTHEFVELCELVNAKPYFAVNVTSMTPMDARDWMDYCLSPKGTTTLALERESNGHPEPFEIPYWGVGNENWGGGGNMTADYYALIYRQFATVLKNVCDKKTELIAGGGTFHHYSWVRDFVDNIAGSSAFGTFVPINGLSLHYYCGSKDDGEHFTGEKWDELILSAKKMETYIRQHYAFLEAYGLQNSIKLVIDEWGCMYPGGEKKREGKQLYEQPSTMRDAVVTALTLNIFNNYCDCIKMANVAQVCNCLHSLFLTRGEECIVTPVYHVFDMFKGHQGAECLRTIDGEANKNVSVSASIKEDQMTITLANLSCEKDVAINLEFLGLKQTIKEAGAYILAAEDMHAGNTFEKPENVKPFYTKLDMSTPITVPKAGVVAVTVILESIE